MALLTYLAWRYSTCSLNPVEDEAVVAAALAKYDGAAEVPRSGAQPREAGTARQYERRQEYDKYA